MGYFALKIGLDPRLLTRNCTSTLGRPQLQYSSWSSPITSLDPRPPALIEYDLSPNQSNPISTVYDPKMSDLLASLLIAKSNSSQESFQSSYSQPPPSSGPAAASSAPDAHPPASSQTQASAFQDAGFSVSDIDSFLAEAKNLALSTQASNEGSDPQHKSAQMASNRLEPISLGSKTRHHVSALNILCQAKGLTAVFEIDGVVDFGGVLKIGETTVKSEERWKSKKDAKEGLAEKGLDIVKALDAKGKQSQKLGEAGKNWVGMLLGECISLEQHYVISSADSAR